MRGGGVGKERGQGGQSGRTQVSMPEHEVCAHGSGSTGPDWTSSLGWNVGSVCGWAAKDNTPEQRFSTRVLRELLKLAVADHVVRGTDPFSPFYFVK